MRKIIYLTGLLALLLAGSALAQKTITVWSGYPELEAFYQHVADQFEADNPDVNIEILTQPLRQYERRLLVTLPANSSGCILEIGTTFAGRLIRSGLIPPLPEDLQGFVRSEAYNDFLVAKASYDGEVYGVPLFRGQGTLFYNTEMFEEAGLSGPPQTMEEYVEFAKKLTVRNESGETTRSGWSLRLSGGGGGVAEKFGTILHQFGGSIVEQRPDGTWVAAYDNEAGQKTLALYVNLVSKYNVVPPALKGDAEGFELGTTAMFIRESWVIEDIAKKAPDLPYATALLPRGTIVLPVNLYVTCDDPAAYEFVRYVMKPENQKWLLENVGWLPNRQDVDYSQIIEETPQLEAFLNIPEEHVLYTPPSIKPIAEIQTRLAERLVGAYTNENLVDNPEGIQEFLQEAAEETNAILQREGLQ